MQINVTFRTIAWQPQFVKLSNRVKIPLHNRTKKIKQAPIQFKARSLSHNPSLSAVAEHSWIIKSASVIERPRFIITGFQMNKQNEVTKDILTFEHIGVIEICAYINSTRYPYKIDEGRF